MQNRSLQFATIHVLLSANPIQINSECEARNYCFETHKRRSLQDKHVTVEYKRKTTEEHFHITLSESFFFEKQEANYISILENWNQIIKKQKSKLKCVLLGERWHKFLTSSRCKSKVLLEESNVIVWLQPQYQNKVRKSKTLRQKNK